MNFLLRMWGILTTIPNRLLAQLGLVLAALFGLVTSISLIMSVPLYADSVYYQILQEKVSQESGTENQTRPPFTYLFHYYGGWHGSLQWEDIQPLDTYFRESSAAALGLPQKQAVRYIRTDSFPLFPPDESVYDERSALSWTSLGFMSDLAENIQIVSGRFPADAPATGDGPVEVLMSEALALKLGLQAGEIYTAYIKSQTPSGSQVTNQIPVQIAGTWQPIDPDDEYWISHPVAYAEVLFVPEKTFSDSLSVIMPDEVFSAYWYLVMDGSGVNSSDVGSLVSRITRIQQTTGSLLPKIKLAVSPAEKLIAYQKAANLLTILLFAFSIPIVGLILAFIGQVANLSIERQRNEIAVVRSRGATSSQVLSIIFLEGLLLVIIAFLISIPVATQVTRVIGQTRSFLDFSLQTDLRVNLSFGTLRLGMGAAVIALVAMVVPAFGAARQTIVSYKQESGRTIRPPWWQRAWLDFLLFIPAFYGAYMLKEQGRIVEIASGGTNDPFRNPLLFLVPALGILAFALFSLRLIQPLMSGIAWLASQSKNVGLVLAARQLSRTPGSFNTPLVILILTVSLSSYTASLAYTLDHHLHDQTYYQIGGDMRFMDLGDTPQTNPFGGLSGGPGGGSGDNASQSPAELSGPRFVFLPISEYLKIDGVQSVARLGKYPATADLGTNSNAKGTFIGIDRVEFPQVSFWRDDFAAESLGGLMNELAPESAGILVNRSFMQQYVLQEGQNILLHVKTYDQEVESKFQIVGSFDLFPTWYPEEGPLFVGNLDYLFEQSGGEFPYRVLLRTNKDLDYNQLAEQVLNVWLMNLDSSEAYITAIQSKPERQGLFGLLFIGFAAAGILTVLAFLLYVLFSFQRRFIELGVLRAAGLSTGQMTAYLVWELTSLILIGGTIGTVLGYFASKLFIPYHQIGAKASELVPSFQVLIDWQAVFQIYALFGVLFTMTVIVSVILLRRMKIFQAIKLGETI